MSNIKISAYFLTYNSEKIIHHLLRYYTQFCKKITILDNCSTDNTEKICKQYSNVEFVKFDTKNTFNDLANKQLKNTIWQKDIDDFDYVILGDCDEFLYHQDGILNFLEKNQAMGYNIFKAKGYHMVAYPRLDLKDADNIFEKINAGYRIPSMDKPILFNCKQVRDIYFTIGCHSHSTNNPNAKVYYFDDFKLLHFKFLGLEYHLDRCRKIKTRMSEFNLENKVTMYYLEDDEYHTKDYMHFYNNGKVIL